MNRVQEQLLLKDAPECLRRQCGVTLIELMVALALGLLITVAMLKVYVDASGLYRFNEGLARVQENGRFALEFIRRDTRVAGFWGCDSDVTPNNLIDEDSSAYINVLAGHIKGLEGEEATDPDSITLRSAYGAGFLVTGDMGSKTSNIAVDPEDIEKIDFDPDDPRPLPLLISDCESADLFQLTDKSGSTLAHELGDATNISDDLSKAYLSGSRVYQVREITYCVADGTGTDESGNPIPSLRRAYGKDSADACETGDELVEGIQNMQILYGEDTDADSDGANGDGTANRYVDIDTAGLDVDRIVSVRLSLLARSLNNNLTTTPSPYTYPPWVNPPTLTTPADKRLRKVFTTTITLRNKAR
ncbi:MAG: prepilin-type N-terminal cleavage/methylation domain-containing protein [Acidiferrobacteraceae bacterium]|nr:prepilin-type N-terminal cleavage/methylation domain-containing protein [Acidiferrobacteraceae bacterium]